MLRQGLAPAAFGFENLRFGLSRPGGIRPFEELSGRCFREGSLPVVLSSPMSALGLVSCLRRRPSFRPGNCPGGVRIRESSLRVILPARKAGLSGDGSGLLPFRLFPQGSCSGASLLRRRAASGETFFCNLLCWAFVRGSGTGDRMFVRYGFSRSEGGRISRTFAGNCRKPGTVAYGAASLPASFFLHSLLTSPTRDTLPLSALSLAVMSFREDVSASPMTARQVRTFVGNVSRRPAANVFQPVGVGRHRSIRVVRAKDRRVLRRNSGEGPERGGLSRNGCFRNKKSRAETLLFRIAYLGINTPATWMPHRRSSGHWPGEAPASRRSRYPSSWIRRP